MKTRTSINLKLVAAASLLLTIVLAACRPVAPAVPAARAARATQPQPAAPAITPESVVQQFYTLVNAKEVDKAMALTADNYVMNDPFGTYDKAGAAKQWQNVVDAGLTFEQTNFKNSDGRGRVTSCYLVRENGKEIDKGCNNVTHVRDGKIIFDGLEPAENVWIVQRYHDAVNKGDIDTAATYITDDAVFINPTGSYKNKAEIVAGLRAQAKDGLTFELSNFREKDGRVVYDYVVKQKGDTLDKGMDGLTKVKAGKIIFDGTEKTEPAK
jgi:ketosteroid isomerase-like protein